MQLFMVFISFIASISAQDCPAGYWGTDCNFRCGMCKNESDGVSGCNKDNGKCLTQKGCETGYTGEDCQTPQCFFNTNADQCGSGRCASPDNCVCTGLTAKDETGKCYSLRIAGLKGAAISIGVLIVSILACQGGYKFAHSQN